MAISIPSHGWQAILKPDLVYYTYILQSVVRPAEFYRGHTSNLKHRLADHNSGKCFHTAKFTPWELKFYGAFETLELAEQFERYLKSGSGHEFAKRHFGVERSERAA